LEPVNPERKLEPVNLVDMIRREEGFFALMSDEEFERYKRNFENCESILSLHEPRKFDGDALIIVATQNKYAPWPGPLYSTDKWSPFISGEISEFYVSCRHIEMTRPDMLARAWDGISTWLGLADD
jgi:hypothetical protein